MYDKFVDVTRKLVADDLAGVKLHHPSTYAAIKDKSPKEQQKFLRAETFKEFSCLPDVLAEAALDLIGSGQLANFLTTYLSPDKSLGFITGKNLAKMLNAVCNIYRGQLTWRFWFHAMIEDLNQDAGQIPIPSVQAGGEPPHLTLERAIEVLKYDPILLPPQHLRTALVTNIKAAGVGNPSPRKKDNDFMFIVSYRYLQDLCKIYGVVSRLFLQ